LKVKVQSHKVNGGNTFTIDLPVRCGKCGYHFTQRVQVGINGPFITCPLCYCCSYLKLTWHLSRNTLTDGDVVEVIISKQGKY